MNTARYELGFGTEYEKFVLRDIAQRIIRELKPTSICEYPANNLMGDNSEVFEGFDLRIDRLSNLDAVKREAYDLVWNFCEVEQREDITELVQEMLMLTRRYLFVVLQNRRNAGVCLHRIYHSLTAKRWDHGHIGLMSPTPLVRLLTSYGKIISVDYFDVPWFILDVYECGAYLRVIIPRFMRSKQHLKKSRFEEMSCSCKRWLAHHAYVLFEKFEAEDKTSVTAM